jgi:hypothetical protein
VNEKKDELTNQRVTKDFQALKSTTIQGNNLERAPLVDETFMAHSVPQMNLYEYKHRGNVKVTKKQHLRTANKDTQTETSISANS